MSIDQVLPKELKPTDPAMLIHPFKANGDEGGVSGERGPKGGYTVADCSGHCDTDQLLYAAVVAVDSNGNLWIRGGSHQVCKWQKVAQGIEKPTRSRIAEAEAQEYLATTIGGTLRQKPMVKVEQGECLNILLSPGTSSNVHLPSGTVLNFDVTPDTLNVADQEGWVVLSENCNIGAPEDLEQHDVPPGSWYREYPNHPRRAKHNG